MTRRSPGTAGWNRSSTSSPRSPCPRPTPAPAGITSCPGPAGALVAGQDVIPAGAGVGLGHGLRGLEVEERFHPAVPGDRRVIGGVRGRELRDVQVLVRRVGAVEEPDPGRLRQMGLVPDETHLPPPPGVRFFNGSVAPDKHLNIPQFSTTYATDDTSIARHGRMESFLNLESAQP